MYANGQPDEDNRTVCMVGQSSRVNDDITAQKDEVKKSQNNDTSTRTDDTPTEDRGVFSDRVWLIAGGTVAAVTAGTVVCLLRRRQNTPTLNENEEEVQPASLQSGKSRTATATPSQASAAEPGLPEDPDEPSTVDTSATFMSEPDESLNASETDTSTTHTHLDTHR